MDLLEFFGIAFESWKDLVTLILFFRLSFFLFFFLVIPSLVQTQQSAQQACIQLKLGPSPTTFALDARKERIPRQLV